MNCKKCGKEIDENSKFCKNCGTSVISETNYKTENIENDSNANILCIFSLVLNYGIGLILEIITYKIGYRSNLIESLTGICYIMGLALLIIARVKYPKNKFAKIVMWLYIIMFIIGIIISIIIAITCTLACNSIKGNANGCY